MLFFFIKETKLLQFKDNRPIGVLSLPMKPNKMHSIIPDKENSFYVITSDKLYNFMIFANGTALLLRSINNEMKNSFLWVFFLFRNYLDLKFTFIYFPINRCSPFYNNGRGNDIETTKNNEKLRNIFCYDLSLINSVIKFNSTTGLLLSGSELKTNKFE